MRDSALTLGDKTWRRGLTQLSSDRDTSTGGVHVVALRIFCGGTLARCLHSVHVYTPK